MHACLRMQRYVLFSIYIPTAKLCTHFFVFVYLHICARMYFCTRISICSFFPNECGPGERERERERETEGEREVQELGSGPRLHALLPSLLWVDEWDSGYIYIIGVIWGAYENCSDLMLTRAHLTTNRSLPSSLPLALLSCPSSPLTPSIHLPREK